MTLAVIFVTSALLLYTLSIWSERLTKQLKRWMVAIFGIGLICDFTGTTIMALQPNAGNLNAHSFFGYSALIIMLVHFIWAYNALKSTSKSTTRFHRFSIYAWIIWMTAFISGLPWHIILN